MQMHQEKDWGKEFEALSPREKYAKLLEIIGEIPPIDPKDDPEREEASNRFLFLLESSNDDPSIDIRSEVLSLIDQHPDSGTLRTRSAHYQDLAAKYKDLNHTAPITEACKEFLGQQFEKLYATGDMRNPKNIPLIMSFANDEFVDLRQRLATALGPSLPFLLGIDNPNEDESYFNPDSSQEFERVRYSHVIKFTLKGLLKSISATRGVYGPEKESMISEAAQRIYRPQASFAKRWRSDFTTRYGQEPQD